MKTSISILFVCISLLNPACWAQKGKNWPSCIDYQLQGKVKSWTMKSADGIVRKQQFDKTGKLISDSYQGNPQDFFPQRLPQKLKLEYEKVHAEHSSKQTNGIKMVFNKRMQLVEKKMKDYHETSNFNEKGQILVHKEAVTTTETRAWNGPHHAEPTYTFTHTESFLAIYKYNPAGFIQEFEYYHSDPFKNLRTVYIYDAANRLLETNHYDSYNISVASMPDNYIDKFFNKNIGSDFSINKYYPDYWSQGTPVKETWEYNDQGQKTTYTTYGYRSGPSFKVTWEYSKTGRISKEIHHDVYHNTIRCSIDFDEIGNVVKEIDYDYWAKKEYTFTYEIEYH